MKFRSRWKEDPEINLIPLIDVLLVILIFLMVTTTYSKYSELQINLPTANAEKQVERPNELNITVDALGAYTINGRATPFNNVPSLSDAMRRAAGDLENPVVIISADAKASHQSVVHVMEAARMAGYTHVTFATQSTEQ
ncbi:MAG TPA: biopolymer transporter ExbD [Burkholderiales bacterium]|nr:biopolymer transporter ExbD [Burkholderiales bacterium]